MESRANSTIYGENIFFNFIEEDFNNPNIDSHLIQKIHTGELDGVVTKNVFSKKEVKEILDKIPLIPEDEILSNYVGKSFPHDFGTVTNNGERMDNYIERSKTFQSLPFDIIPNRLKQFFNKIGQPYKIDKPTFRNRGVKTSPGNFRMLMPNRGGLFVHCGYLLQESAQFYYNAIDNITKDGQLSYFVMLRYPEKGGELTIYDLLWDDIKEKDIFEQNEYVIDANGDKVYLEGVSKFNVRPEPGDVLVFSGGPIWHRVEDIKGELPRITFGGFINFTPDDTGFYHWS